MTKPTNTATAALTDWERGYEAAILDLLDAEESAMKAHENQDFGSFGRSCRHEDHARTLAVIQRLLEIKRGRYDRHGKRITN